MVLLRSFGIKSNKNANAEDYEIIKPGLNRLQHAGLKAMQCVRQSTEACEYENGVEEITAETFGPFVEER